MQEERNAWGHLRSFLMLYTPYFTKSEIRTASHRPLEVLPWLFERWNYTWKVEKLGKWAKPIPCNQRICTMKESVITGLRRIFLFTVFYAIYLFPIFIASYFRWFWQLSQTSGPLCGLRRSFTGTATEYSSACLFLHYHLRVKREFIIFSFDNKKNYTSHDEPLFHVCFQHYLDNYLHIWEL